MKRCAGDGARPARQRGAQPLARIGAFSLRIICVVSFFADFITNLQRESIRETPKAPRSPRMIRFNIPEVGSHFVKNESNRKYYYSEISD